MTNEEREAVKRQMIKYGFKAPDMTVTEFVEDCLPSVTPKAKTGQWFIDERTESDREVVCSNCDQPIFKYHKLDFDYRPKYCPNCGARMAESEDEE